ncbi:MAG: DUF3108 domain-containing protein [Bryobacteraceae bacterium]
MKWLLGAALCLHAFAQAPKLRDETLNYTVNWPSGLSLGEGQMRARRVPAEGGQSERWDFRLTLDASIPGFQVAERYRAIATPSLCSLELEKNTIRGKRKTVETSTFDAERNIMVRTTGGGGGRSETPIPACARDALTFLYHLRMEMAQGRIPPAQKVFFGAAYDVRVQFGGVQRVPVGEETVEADRFQVSFKGPASEMTFELALARDEARTPLIVKVPLAMGSFSMELAR